MRSDWSLSGLVESICEACQKDSQSLQYSISGNEFRQLSEEVGLEYESYVREGKLDRDRIYVDILSSEKFWRLADRCGVEWSLKDERGYVYVLVSSANPGLVKIGMTKRDPEVRAQELSSHTGVAMPYIVAYQAEVTRPSALEKAVHERLSQGRVNPDREFFEVKTREAIRTIEETLREGSFSDDETRGTKPLSDAPGRGISKFEPVAQEWRETDEDEAIVLSDLNRIDVQNLRVLLYYRFGRENVSVNFAVRLDGSHVAAVIERPCEYLHEKEMGPAFRCVKCKNLSP